MMERCVAVTLYWLLDCGFGVGDFFRRLSYSNIYIYYIYILYIYIIYILYIYTCLIEKNGTLIVYYLFIFKKKDKKKEKKKIINNECAILFNKTCINESLLPKYIYIFVDFLQKCIKSKCWHISLNILWNYAFHLVMMYIS